MNATKTDFVDRNFIIRAAGLSGATGKYASIIITQQKNEWVGPLIGSLSYGSSDPSVYSACGDTVHLKGFVERYYRYIIIGETPAMHEDVSSTIQLRVNDGFSKDVPGTMRVTKFGDSILLEASPVRQQDGLWNYIPDIDDAIPNCHVTIISAKCDGVDITSSKRIPSQGGYVEVEFKYSVDYIFYGVGGCPYTCAFTGRTETTWYFDVSANPSSTERSIRLCDADDDVEVEVKYKGTYETVYGEGDDQVFAEPFTFTQEAAPNYILSVNPTTAKFENGWNDRKIKIDVTSRIDN